MQPAEFTDLIRQHGALLARVAWAWCRDAADREDVVQQIVLELWRSRDRFDGRSKVTTWMHRVAWNVAISFQRRERRHRRGRQPLLDAHLMVGGSEPDADGKRLLRCVDALPPLDRALVLLWLEGHDHAAIGEVLGLGTSNVGTKLARLRERLRSAFVRGACDEREHP